VTLELGTFLDVNMMLVSGIFAIVCLNQYKKNSTDMSKVRTHSPKVRQIIHAETTQQLSYNILMETMQYNRQVPVFIFTANDGCCCDESDM
jgi:hypothetical protein